jgi:hypothetical protein
MGWQIVNPPSPPVISGSIVRHLWVAGFGDPSRLVDVVGSADLLVDRGESNLSARTPGGLEAIQFDGSLRYSNPGVTFGSSVLCALVHPSDENFNRALCGFGDVTSSISMAQGSNNFTFGARSDGVFNNGNGPANQWFVPLMGQSVSLFQIFNNSFGSFGANTFDVRVGLSLGSGHLGLEPSFKGDFYGLVMFDCPGPGFVDFPEMDGLGRYWFESGAIGPVVAGSKLLAMSGDSIEHGAFLPYASSLPALVQATLPTWDVYSVGIPAVPTPTNVRGDRSFIDPLASGVRDVQVAMLVGEPTNQISEGATLAACRASVIEWRMDRELAGFDTVICSVLPVVGFNPAQEAIRQGFNTLLRAEYALITTSPYVFGKVGSRQVFADIDAIPGVTYSDGVHPDAAGAELIAPVLAFAAMLAGSDGGSSRRRVRNSGRARRPRR